MKIDIAVILETKKKLIGTSALEKYIIIYSGVPQRKHVSEGVAIWIKGELKEKVQSHECVNERIVKLRIQYEHGKQIKRFYNDCW